MNAVKPNFILSGARTGLVAAGQLITKKERCFTPSKVFLLGRFFLEVSTPKILMDNDDKYQKIPLTASIAEEVIVELFAGKDPVSRREISRKVTAHYTINGGLVPKGNPVSLFKKALDNLKEAGRARNLHGGYWSENLHGGYWKILPFVSDSSEEILFAETEAKAKSVDDLVENLLTVIKAEIKNLDEDIEALQRQKSDLEENLTKFNRIWQNLSQK